jgi:hypothetical protein
MQLRKRLLMSTLCWLNIWGQAPADEYRTVFVVEHKSPEIPKEIAQSALYEVLSKRSGLIINTLPQEAQPNIVTMIDRYDYEKTACPEREEQTCFTLTMQFNPDNINSFMEANEIKAWGKKRPSTLLWLNQTSTTGTQLITIYHPLARHLEAQCKARNLSLLLPSGDITDQQIQSTDVSASAIDYLKSKYHVDAILNGSINEDSPLTATWNHHSKQHHDWNSQNESLETAVTMALDHMVNVEVQSEQSALSKEKNSTTLEIKNIQSIDDFSVISSHLMHYDFIDDVSIASIGPNYIAIEVVHRDETEQLLAQLQNDAELQSNIDSPNYPQAQASYEWIKKTYPAT